MTEIETAFKEAVSAQQAGRLAEAIEGYERVLSADPSRFTALNNLGMALYAQGRLDEAATHFRRALDVKDNALTRNNLGIAFRELGRHEDAAEAFRGALALDPAYADAHSNLGLALVDLGRMGEAVGHLERAVALKPDAPHLQCNLGNARQAQGRIEEAVALYRRALAINPDYAEAHNNLATALVTLGDHEEAVKHYRRAVALRPELGGAQRQLAQLDPGSVDTAAIERLLGSPSLPKLHRPEMHFALAEVERARGHHDLAFAQYAEANRLKRLLVQFDSAVHAREIDELIRVYSRDFFERRTGYGVDSELPVFIIGFPRSGTTLVEQILASHPAVHGGGELPYLPAMVKRLSEALGAQDGYPAGMRRVQPDLVRALGEEYLQKLRRAVSGGVTATRITDKLPDNYLRLGLIHLMLPRARIIHCRRDPRDACLSLFFQSFTGRHAYAWDLQDIGAAYRGYHRLMAHWRTIYAAEIMLEVRYEELVEAQESVSRRLLRFAGLEWDPRCLEFYRTNRPVTSASHAGVRRPVYRDAVGRWRAYRKHLWPLVQALGPIVEEYTE